MASGAAARDEDTGVRTTTRLPLVTPKARFTTYSLRWTGPSGVGARSV